MRFELEPHHRDTPDDTLIADLCRVAGEVGSPSVTIDQYNDRGRYHATTLTRRFGSWFKALELAAAAAWDHVEFVRRRRIPAAIIMHVYAKTPLAECHALAAAHGLTFEPLPWSWHYPHGTAAGVYLRADLVLLQARA